MKFKRILVLGIIVIFMTGTLSTEAATMQSSPALEPWTIGVIDRVGEGYLGLHVSIDHYKLNGRAYVSYWDSTFGNLKLAYEVSPGTGNCPGNPNWKCETVDSSVNNVGLYSSIDVSDDFTYPMIGISYYDATAEALKFALWRCYGSSCSWTITTVEDDTDFLFPADIGKYSSFQFDGNSIPVIYYQSSNIALGRVKRAQVSWDVSGDCDSGWACEIVARSMDSADYGTHISAAGGKVVFYDSVNHELLVATHYTGDTPNSSCGLSNFWICEVIDSAGDVGKFVSLHYEEGHSMHLAYYNATLGTLKYAISVPPGTGNCTNPGFICFAVDTVGLTSDHIGISVSMDDHVRPIIGYQHFPDSSGPGTLKLARPYSVYNLPYGNCGERPPGFNHLYWQCSVLDSGGQYQDEAHYAAISVNPAGLSTVAYYENDTYYNEGHLKVAQQHFTLNLPLISK